MSEAVGTTGSSYRWWVLVMASLVNIVIGLAWMCMPVLFSEISMKTGWSIQKLLASWGLIPPAIVILNLPAGLIGDKFSIRWFAGIGVLIMSLVGALRGLSDSYGAFVVWTFLFGCTFPFAGVLLPKALGMVFSPRELGMANGIVLAANGAASAFSLTFSGTLISGAVGGWQNVVYLYGALSLLVGLLWLFTIKDSPSEHADAASRAGISATLSGLLKNREVLALCLINFLFLGGRLGVSGSFPALAVEGRGLGMQKANFAVSVSLIAYIVGCLVVPTISDKIGLRRPIYSVGMLIAGLCLFLFCISLPPMIWVWAVVLGVTAGAIPLIIAMPMEMKNVGPAVGGAAIGLISAFGNLGGFLFPMVVAGVASRMNPSAALVWIGILCGIFGYGITGLLIWLVKETGHKVR